MIDRRWWMAALAWASGWLLAAGSIGAATITHHGVVDGAGQNVMIDYGTPGGGNNGIGYSFVGTQPWTNISGGTAGNTATETALRLGSFAGAPKRVYPSFLSADNVNYTKLPTSATPSTDAVRVSVGTSGGANFGAFRFRYGMIKDPANPAPANPDDKYVQSLVLFNNRAVGTANADGSWDLIDLHVNGAVAPPPSFLFGVVVDNGRGNNDNPDTLRLRQIAAGAGGSIGADAGPFTMTNFNAGDRGAANYVALPDQLATPPALVNETDVYWFRIDGAVLGDVFTLSGTNNLDASGNPTNIPFGNMFVFANIPEPTSLAMVLTTLGLAALRRRKRD